MPKRLELGFCLVVKLAQGGYVNIKVTLSRGAVMAKLLRVCYNDQTVKGVL